VKPTRLSLVQARGPAPLASGASGRRLWRRVETPHWRNVRTAQGSVAA